ncbi:tRNA methyltransferase [Aureococcus anophagefferens]|uniref:tRNA methyltransferase n=1 Tax=Aureococcus anophagefferens TaxID=44056 RepID=A0ABR1G3B1_AURAN
MAPATPPSMDVSAAKDLDETELRGIALKIDRALAREFRRRGVHSSIAGNFKRMFKEIDVDGSNRITLKELDEAVRIRLGLGEELISRGELLSLWKYVDEDRSGELTPDEFQSALYLFKISTWPDYSHVEHQRALSACLATMNGAADKWHKAGGNWFKIFRRMDTDESGSMGFEEIEAVVRTSFPGLNLKPEELGDEAVRGLWKALDVDRSGLISVQEFMIFMRRHAKHHEVLAYGGVPADKLRSSKIRSFDRSLTLSRIGGKPSLLPRTPDPRRRAATAGSRRGSPRGPPRAPAAPDGASGAFARRATAAAPAPAAALAAPAAALASPGPASPGRSLAARSVDSPYSLAGSWSAPAISAEPLRQTDGDGGLLALRLRGDVHVRVSNLPWTTSVASVEASLRTACDRVNIAPHGIEVKGVDRRRKRDAQKQHGGSARLSFAEGDDARAWPPWTGARSSGRTASAARPRGPGGRLGGDAADADPARAGGSGRARAARKRLAVEAFGAVLPALLAGSARRRCVDVGAGTGNLAVPLGLWALDEVVAVDINGETLRLLEARAGANVRALEADAAALTVRDTDCVVSLHACGAVSDLAMDAALDAQIPFAISPCCLGKSLTDRAVVGGRMPRTSAQRAARPSNVEYPRSRWLASELEDASEWGVLAAAADYGVGADDDDDVARVQRRAKRVVETDRLAYAAERGYVVRLLDLPADDPRYPKRELLLGAPRGSPAAAAIANLPTAAPRYAA